MRPRPAKPRLLTAALAAAGVSLALAASAAAVAYVYNNSFGKARDFNEVSRSGSRGCEERYRSESKAMLVKVKGKRLCDYSPPVIGDSAQPDHEVLADARVLKKRTPRNVRKAAYLAVRVRAGKGDFYELQIRPKVGRFKLSRKPDTGGLPLSGESNAIKGLDETNRLRLRVTDAQVAAFVNGTKVASFTDPNPGQVEGRKVSFGLGSGKDVNDGPAAVFERVRVGVPNP